MIVTKTPFRVSFFGGGTDYPEYFTSHGGAVLATAIDKYAYVSISKFHSRLFDYSTRVSYRKVECVKSVEEIQHRPFRECLQRFSITGGVEVNYTAELPGYSGMGSSSTFVVGLINALHAYRDRRAGPLELAREAIEIERDVLGECVGYQDQTVAASGRFNLIEFGRDSEIVVKPVPVSADRLREFEEHLFLVYTGVQRRAADVAAPQVQRISLNLERLAMMKAMTYRACDLLSGSSDVKQFGQMLHEGWCLKSSLHENVGNDQIRDIYRTGLANGAIGGKLLGAGSGGFFLFFVPPHKRQVLKESLGRLEEIAFRINAEGSRVVLS
jgi:D-glycero-alpha-D-manno-heptose-7-phosphate kinase